MIVDTSALVAVVFQEPGFESVLGKLSEAPRTGIGAPTLVESTIVLSARLDDDARGLMARLLQELGAVIVPFGEAHFGAALEAWLRYGKGRHPAALDFGDCLAYAVARVAGQPLLCVGDDFGKTDLDLA